MWLLFPVVAVALVVWYALNPSPLQVRTEDGEVSVPAGTAVFVGVAALDPGRDLLLRDVEVDGATTGTEVELLMCRDGRISTTTSAEAFCGLVLPVSEESLTMGSADQLILRVASEDARTVAPGPVRVAFREGLQWGEQEIDPRFEITFLDRGAQS